MAEDEKPRTLKLDLLDLAVLESVELAVDDRTFLNAPADPNDPAYDPLMAPAEPAILSGAKPCDSDACYY
jgi:hypothetical protein